MEGRDFRGLGRAAQEALRRRALFLIEREEKLAALACAAVLVDSRRTRCRRSLRWDVLPVRLPTGAAQHAKITLLVWERLVRAVVASANLTEAGYLRQQEVFGVLDCPIGGEGPSAVLRDVVDFLDEHVKEPALHCRWHWSEGDLAVWDERSTLHRAAADHFPYRRVIRRLEIDGDVPYFDPSAP